ncbi:MAG: pyruvate kinase [Bilophila sp.]
MSKLLVTLGTTSLNSDCITKMCAFNPYVFRLNMSHVQLDDLETHIRLIQSTTSVPVCIDSEGAQIRTHAMHNGSVCLTTGDEVEFLEDLREGTAERFSLTPAGIAGALREGDVVRLDWHGVRIRVVSVRPRILGVVEEGGEVASRKAVDVNRELPLAAITPKDREALRMGRDMGVTHFALSFAGTAEALHEFRSLAGDRATIISKIESLSALQNLASVLQATDEALIDRGDLSRVVQLEKIPFLQMRIISLANIYQTPIFVATNLLESMIQQGIPTRAELNDVVSSLLAGANGLVLAAESAVGQHPVGCVKTIRTLMNLCGKWTPNASLTEIMEM